MASHSCRLRAFRKTSGLSQRALAVLLGLKSQSLISQYETDQKRPGLEALLACETVFGAPAAMIFPGLVDDIVSKVAARAEQLAARPLGRPPPRARKFLSILINRKPQDNQNV